MSEQLAAERLQDIRKRLEDWRENAAEEDGDQDLVLIFEAHAADDVSFLLEQIAALQQRVEELTQERNDLRERNKTLSQEAASHIGRLRLHMEEVVLARRERDQRHELQLKAEQRVETVEQEAVANAVAAQAEADRAEAAEARLASLAELFQEYRRIDRCGPDSPWCADPSYGNTDHFDGHVDERRAVLDQIAAVLAEGPAPAAKEGQSDAD